MSSLAILGVASHVGKTTIGIALCRYFALQNKNISPFKAFNLSSESFCFDGLEIGYGQYLQAIAAKQVYDSAMNPLFNCYKHNVSQYFLLGKKCSQMSINEQRDCIDKAYFKLLHKHDLVIVEGSGSILELNLKEFDLANLNFVQRHHIPTILVIDMSRGGVFGTIYGHLALLSVEERQLIKGLILNKFTGNLKDFQTGVEIIEKISQISVLGVIPTFDFTLPEEDSRVNETSFSHQQLEKNIAEITEIVTKNLDMEYIEKLCYNLT